MKKLTLITLLLIATTTALTGCQNSNTEQNTEPENTTKTETSEKAKKVETFIVGEDTKQPSTTSKSQAKKIGILEPIQKLTIKSEVTGKIEGINFIEGQKIDAEKTVITLGPSLNADLQEINFQNAIVSLKNAEEQLAAKREANLANLENSKLTIAQAEVQLETAKRTRTNLSRSTQLSLDHLVEQNFNTQDKYYLDTKDIREQLYSNYEYTDDSNQNSYSTHYSASEYIAQPVSDPSQPPSYNPTSNNNSTTSTSTSTPQTNTQPSREDLYDQYLKLEQQYRTTQTQYYQGIEKNNDSYINQATSAESQIALAEIQLENARQLLELKKIQYQLEEQQLTDQIEQLAGQAAIADRNLQTREIKSPINGTLLKKLVEPGELISPGQAVAEIGKTQKLKVAVSVTQSELQKLNPLQEVIIEANGKTIPGIIIKIPTTFNSQSKTGKLEIELDNSNSALKPGMIVKVDLETISKAQEPKEGIWIPLKAIYFQDETYVYIVNDKKAEKRIVETGRIENNMIEITKGIKTKDEIITERFEISEGIEVSS